MDAPTTIGERLKLARSLAEDLSAARLSELAGLATSHVGLIERGDVENPTTAVVQKLADALGASRMWLLFGEGTAPTQEQVRAAIAARTSHTPAA